MTNSAVDVVTNPRRTSDARTCARIGIQWSKPAGALLGAAIAFAIVLLWFPRSWSMWNLPLQEVDAPAHYYFVQRLLDEGIGAATHLNPNDSYYPPMFHLMAAGLIKLFGLFGAELNIYAAVNVVWLFGSAIVWPVGMQVFAGYWLRRAGCGPVFSGAMLALVPVLSVSSACHPFQMLSTGPLLAYGLATSLLPLWLYATLRLLDAIMARTGIVRWLIFTAVTGGLCVFAHPRIAFTWLLLIAPFVLTRVSWKLIAGLSVAVVAGGVAFFLYMVTHFSSSRYFDPSSWFHTYEPNRTVPEAIAVFLTENIAGPQGVLLAVIVLISCAVAVGAMVKPRLFGGLRYGGDMAAVVKPTKASLLRRDAMSITADFLLIGLIYVCSTSLTGWFPNIVTAVWYRSEPRPLTMIPLGVIPLIIFAAVVMPNVQWRKLKQPLNSAIVLVVLTSLVTVLQVNNTVRANVAQAAESTTVVEGGPADAQLSETKYQVLEDVSRTVEDDATVISDPMNGSMYAQTLFDVDMLYPVVNPKVEGDGAVFRDVQTAFSSGDSNALLTTVCSVSAGPEYFLSMGEQAPSLLDFTYRDQYDPFHNQTLISQYVRDGSLIEVEDYSSLGSDTEDWALYQFNCGD
ncbi:hypothetical protein BLEM_1324 [Bifidobacterium lemurum]|uniref:Transmembrane protein alanine and leucine rich n=1 Tax=Bifidobacterium lemurum TaxID=1603886 RepID=A0A261FRK3_9BIFI|nr:DUF6541 family protein [Bifidobacterium lemurum]OZG61787.1 hypothetical protein BLEM_1324 [Bifidobacterium lemurum]